MDSCCSRCHVMFNMPPPWGKTLKSEWNSVWWKLTNKLWDGLGNMIANVCLRKKMFLVRKVSSQYSIFKVSSASKCFVVTLTTTMPFKKSNGQILSAAGQCCKSLQCLLQISILMLLPNFQIAEFHTERCWVQRCMAAQTSTLAGMLLATQCYFFWLATLAPDPEHHGCAVPKMLLWWEVNRADHTWYGMLMSQKN